MHPVKWLEYGADDQNGPGEQKEKTNFPSGAKKV
jgi:hypothetical protein